MGMRPLGWAVMVGDWRGYGSVAADYRRGLGPRTGQPAAYLVALIGIPPGARVLDVGTGTGAAARVAAEAAGVGGLVVGIDPAPPMLAQAAGRGEIGRASCR